MTAPLRTSGVMRFRRFVVEGVVTALRAAFSAQYARERQFGDLHISHQFPLTKIEYPALVVSFSDRRVQQAGIGMLEAFPDAAGVLRQWAHSRFEGTLDIDIYALSTLDRDLLADAVVELVQFGRLDTQLDQFFVQLYGADTDPVEMIFQQFMLNSDQMDSKGNSATVAPWGPEDNLLYTTGYTLTLNGGFYNQVSPDPLEYISHVSILSYPEGDVPVNLELQWTNPTVHDDEGTVSMTSTVTGIST